MVTSLWPTLCDWLIVVTIASKDVRTLRQMYQFNMSMSLEIILQKGCIDCRCSEPRM